MRRRCCGRRSRIGLRLAYCVAHVGYADTRDHRRVAKDGWRDGEVVEESNSGAKKNRRDVDVDSSTRPAFRSCWMVSAPWTATDFPAAAALAWRRLRSVIDRQPIFSASATRMPSGPRT